MRASLEYQPRQPDRDVLRGVRDHFETLRARAADRSDGSGLPQFVEREFREFLTCGSLAGGFARFRCAACRLERLVAFSCKGRGFCPSCGGRRMTERAAHLVDRVFPAVPVRQWVLTLPPRLRYRLAFDHALCRAVTAAFLGVVFTWLRRRPRGQGITHGQTGAVAIVQRFGAALNLNVHIHALVMDGVFTRDGAGGVAFRPLRTAGAGESGDMTALLATLARRVDRTLARRGTAEDAGVDVTDHWAEAEPPLAGLSAASVRGVGAAGARRGMPVRRWGDVIDRPQPPSPGPWPARLDGFNLHAALVVPAGVRNRLERLCRDALRPAVGQDRVQQMPDGTGVLELRRRWTDGTTHLIFEPVELLERLAALVPRPRINLVLYSGVLAPRAAWRREVVPNDAATETATAHEHESTVHDRPNHTWAELRGFGFDVLACPRCAGRLTLVALIRAPAVIERILRHLPLPTEVPQMRPSREQPALVEHDWDVA